MKVVRRGGEGRWRGEVARGDGEGRWRGEVVWRGGEAWRPPGRGRVKPTQGEPCDLSGLLSKLVLGVGAEPDPS